MCVRICWTPSTTRLCTKSRMARVSGAENAWAPRYSMLLRFPDEPPQQPNR